LFSVYYGFDYGLLAGDDRYNIVGVHPDFVGKVRIIRLREHGRFGNIFFQILNAVLVARHIGCDTIELFAFAGGPISGTYDIAGLRFCVGYDQSAAEPTLVGHFFNSYPFQSTLTGFDLQLVATSADIVLRPLFGHLNIKAEQILDDSNKIVMNFRGGDVFGPPPVHTFYVQPPASYYIKAAEYTRDQFHIRSVLIVAEDDSNPALEVAASSLRDRGFDVDIQHGSFEEDVLTMLNARHLVSPFGTLCEAIAMLSKRLESYFAFRQFESHRYIHPFRPAILTYVLKAHGVRPVRISDPNRDYIPPRAWDKSDHQLSLIRDFPINRLALEDLSVVDDKTDDCYEVFPPRPQMSAAAEAYHLRETLISVRAQLHDLSEKCKNTEDELLALRTGVSWRLSAPLRWIEKKARQLLR
jgi:hypothetical protein